MDKNELREKIKRSAVVESFIVMGKNNSCFHNLQLIGGAVVDILDGRIPKDYDFIGHNESVIEIFLNDGYEYQHESKSAITLKKNDVIVQFLNRAVEEFDFKISTTSFSVRQNILTIDRVSFEKRLLIPVNYEGKGRLVNALKRIPHWLKKGYRIKDVTYLSMVNAAFTKNYTDMNS